MSGRNYGILFSNLDRTNLLINISNRIFLIKLYIVKNILNQNI